MSSTLLTFRSTVRIPLDTLNYVSLYPASVLPSLRKGILSGRYCRLIIPRICLRTWLRKRNARYSPAILIKICLIQQDDVTSGNMHLRFSRAYCLLRQGRQSTVFDGGRNLLQNTGMFVINVILINLVKIIFLVSSCSVGASAPIGPGPPLFARFLDHTQVHLIRLSKCQTWHLQALYSTGVRLSKLVY